MTTNLTIADIDYEPQGSKVAFSTEEGGPCTAEFDAILRSTHQKVRVKVIFSGSSEIRINDQQDSELRASNPLSVVDQSKWVEKSLHEYVSRFGPKLLPVVGNIKHFLLSGQDMSLGVLARSVSISIVGARR